MFSRKTWAEMTRQPLPIRGDNFELVLDPPIWLRLIFLAYSVRGHDGEADAEDGNDFPGE